MIEVSPISSGASDPQGREPREARETAAYWRTQEMFLIQEVMRLVGKGLEMEGVVREMLHLLSELLGLNRGRVVLKAAEGEGHAIAHAYGLTRDEMARGRYAPGEGITGRVIKDGHLVIVQDIDKEPLFLGRAVDRARLPDGVVAFIALPIQVDGRTVGALACHRIRHRERALADDVTMLRIMATMIGQLLTLAARMDEKTRALEEQNGRLARELRAKRSRYGIIGTAPALLRALEQVEQVSAATASVLLLGESGTGKELFARALHLASPRSDKPFIRVNCAAIPETLFESELFGHERGAFTGATAARMGWFEQAHGGTIFLDEIGEMPLLMQAKLLRVLQEGTVVRLGGTREIKVDMRLVAASNRDLAALVAAGRFREDLFYRLNVIPILLPALAQRREDIPDLVMNFLARVNQDNQRNVNLTPEAVAHLARQPWPGNVRQLSNFIERLVLLAPRPVLDLADVEAALRLHAPEPVALPASLLPASLLTPGLMPAQGEPAFRPYLRATSHAPEELKRALARSGGNKSRAAQILGLTERQFAYRLRKQEDDSA